MPPFRAYEHLLRLAALFAVGVALFLVLRWVLVPSDYGRLGPYRAGALAANQARPIVYAGQAACVDCHSDVADIRKSNAHARISCESCHGPLAGHAMDPAVAAVRPDPRAVCAVCHLPSASKPPGFKTVNFADHAGAEVCTTCHPAHAPKL
jgi:cytochrome c554/c'-like protein